MTQYWWDTAVQGLVYVDVVAFVVFGVIHAIAWSTSGIFFSTGVDERVRSAASLNRTILPVLAFTAGMVAATLVIAQTAHPPPSASDQMLFADTWFILSAIFGLYATFVISVRQSGENILNRKDVGFTYGWQILALLLGLVRFAIGTAFLLTQVSH